jgi:hypothetical protein
MRYNKNQRALEGCVLPNGMVNTSCSQWLTSFIFNLQPATVRMLKVTMKSEGRLDQHQESEALVQKIGTIAVDFQCMRDRTRAVSI